MAIASAIYDTYAEASAAVDRVKASGIADRDVSILSNDASHPRDGYGDYRADSDAGDGAATGAGVGAAAGATVGLLTGLGIMAIPGVGPIVAAGWLAATLAGAGAGAAAGGIVGGLTGTGMSEDDAAGYAEGIRRGGTMVTVRVSDGDQARVQSMLDGGAYKLRDRYDNWRNDGWSGRNAA